MAQDRRLMADYGAKKKLEDLQLKLDRGGHSISDKANLIKHINLLKLYEALVLAVKNKNHWIGTSTSEINPEAPSSSITELDKIFKKVNVDDADSILAGLAACESFRVKNQLAREGQIRPKVNMLYKAIEAISVRIPEIKSYQANVISRVTPPQKISSVLAQEKAVDELVEKIHEAGPDRIHAIDALMKTLMQDRDSLEKPYLQSQSELIDCQKKYGEIYDEYQKKMAALDTPALAKFIEFVLALSKDYDNEKKAIITGDKAAVSAALPNIQGLLAAALGPRNINVDTFMEWRRLHKTEIVEMKQEMQEAAPKLTEAESQLKNAATQFEKAESDFLNSCKKDSDRLNANINLLNIYKTLFETLSDSRWEVVNPQDNRVIQKLKNLLMKADVNDQNNLVHTLNNCYLLCKKNTKSAPGLFGSSIPLSAPMLTALYDVIIKQLSEAWKMVDPESKSKKMELAPSESVCKRDSKKIQNIIKALTIDELNAAVANKNTNTASGTATLSQTTTQPKKMT